MKKGLYNSKKSEKIYGQLYLKSSTWDKSYINAGYINTSYINASLIDLRMSTDTAESIWMDIGNIDTVSSEPEDPNKPFDYDKFFNELK